MVLVANDFTLEARTSEASIPQPARATESVESWNPDLVSNVKKINRGKTSQLCNEGEDEEDEARIITVNVKHKAIDVDKKSGSSCSGSGGVAATLQHFDAVREIHRCISPTSIASVVGLTVRVQPVNHTVIQPDGVIEIKQRALLVQQCSVEDSARAVVQRSFRTNTNSKNIGSNTSSKNINARRSLSSASSTPASTTPTLPLGRYNNSSSSSSNNAGAQMLRCQSCRGERPISANITCKMCRARRRLVCIRVYIYIHLYTRARNKFRLGLFTIV